MGEEIRRSKNSKRDEEEYEENVKNEDIDGFFRREQGPKAMTAIVGGEKDKERRNSSKKVMTQIPKNVFNTTSGFMDDENQFNNNDFQFGEFRKPTILNETLEFTKGRVKYFDSIKEFGFIIPDHETKEIFFHFHDVSDDRLNKEILSLSKVGIVIRVVFRIMDYVGKYSQSKKALQVKILDEQKESKFK